MGRSTLAVPQGIPQTPLFRPTDMCLSLALAVIQAGLAGTAHPSRNQGAVLAVVGLASAAPRVGVAAATQPLVARVLAGVGTVVLPMAMTFW